MANSTIVMTTHERHRIAPESDFTIVVKKVEVRNKVREGVVTKEQTIYAHEFEVATTVMRKYSYFNVALFSPMWADTGKQSYEVVDDDPAAWEVWLRLLHGCLDEAELDVKISSVWNLLVLARKYDLDAHCSELEKWFATWYTKFIERNKGLTVNDCRHLLYPCYHFDHAQAFADITEHLAYNVSGHIEERMPDGVDAAQKEHRIGNIRVIGSLNCARGSLKTKLHIRLYEPTRKLLGCNIKEKVFYQYHKALEQTGAWPIEIQGNKNSISELLRRLGRFKYTDPHDGSDESCENARECKQGPIFSNRVTKAIEETRDQFGGLCLDCMNCSSASADRDEDAEYWNHSKQGPWDTKCRISHGQPTWYFSFLGRREKMDLFQKKDRRR